MTGVDYVCMQCGTTVSTMAGSPDPECCGTSMAWTGKGKAPVEPVVQEVDEVFTDLLKATLNARIQVLSTILNDNASRFPCDKDAVFALAGLYCGMAKAFKMPLEDVVTIVQGFYQHVQPATPQEPS